MNFLATQDRQILKDLRLEKGKKYEVLDIVQDSYKIAIQMKQKNKTKHVLVGEDEGNLID